jgi:hypothetical protein
VNAYIERGRIEFTRMLLFTKKLVTLVWLNDRLVGLTELDKTQRMIGLLHAVLKVMNYYIIIIIVVVVVVVVIIIIIVVVVVVVVVVILC